MNTRGEWKVSPLGLGVLSEDDPDGHYPIADCTGRVSLEECSANAHLIAAAVNGCVSANPDNPMAVAESIKDMYEALKEARAKLALEGYEASYPEIIQVDKALAKAGGKHAQD